MSRRKAKLDGRNKEHHPAGRETDGSVVRGGERLTSLAPSTLSRAVRGSIICTRRCCDFHDVEVNEGNKEDSRKYDALHTVQRTHNPRRSERGCVP